ncbi:uncharacterized protein TRIADDRAFT_51670 [Trichoplax adhaerens]|uniref:G-protein coupled receptors family 1 profile domain-containing protein n=1 Tax=Trichoplax adhaerens TaxID=10228 RepID=B3RKG3_TRIAD|nr:hypothetical protein TRIADDRAFT_51670 [Trichoplax adhaerens]EDV28593.1 hypothetical protein TRIADDRAFT_51670 [Trichoplax adhaerens]|eukprot:XP_002107795.1 hypothetical protein TRIADDRAFT_51670 [Trichoplax adhaerens]
MVTINQTNSTIANPGSIGNSINIYFIYKIPSLHSYNNMLIAHLAVADFLQATLTLPMAIANSLLRHAIPPAMCQAFAFILNFLLAIALAATAAISIDRCLAVIYPYQYQAKMKTNYIIMIVIFIWILAAVLAGTPLLGLQRYGLGEYTFIADGLQCWFDFQYRQRSSIIFIILYIYLLLTILTTLVSYLIIFCIAYNKGIADISAVGYASLRRSIRTTALIVGSNFACFIPTLISVSISYFSQRELNPGLTVAAYLLSFCNSAINPLIYAFTNGILRQKIKQHCCCSKKRYCLTKFGLYRTSKITPSNTAAGQPAAKSDSEPSYWQTVINDYESS